MQADRFLDHAAYMLRGPVEKTQAFSRRSFIYSVGGYYAPFGQVIMRFRYTSKPLISMFDTLLDQLSTVVVDYGLKIVGAVITLVIGLWIINQIVKILQKALNKSAVEESLEQFLGSLISILLKVTLIIVIASQLGVETTSFIAILGAAGLAVGLALQGSLSNFAGGVLILLFKPFKTGDYIEAQGKDGFVKDIQIFNTLLQTRDNRIIIIPNAALSNGNITNYSTEPTLRVDMVFGVSYGDDIKKTRDILLQICESEDLVLKDPAPFVSVLELADSSVNFAVRPWCKTDDYWDVYFRIHEKVKLALDEAGISIPFPQQDVYLHQA